MNNVREIQRINEAELQKGISEEQSWHAQYRGSAWVCVLGLDYRLTEGDVLCVMSQWGEIEDINLVRDEETGRSKGFAFVKYEDWRSTVLAVDNFNGITLLGRTLRVDHKRSYEPPKPKRGADGEAAAAPAGPQQYEPGHAYKGKELANEYDLWRGVNLFARPQAASGAARGRPATTLDDASLEPRAPPRAAGMAGLGHGDSTSDGASPVSNPATLHGRAADSASAAAGGAAAPAGTVTDDTRQHRVSTSRPEQKVSRSGSSSRSRSRSRERSHRHGHKRSRRSRSRSGGEAHGRHGQRRERSRSQSRSRSHSRRSRQQSDSRGHGGGAREHPRGAPTDRPQPAAVAGSHAAYVAATSGRGAAAASAPAGSGRPQFTGPQSMPPPLSWRGTREPAAQAAGGLGGAAGARSQQWARDGRS